MTELPVPSSQDIVARAGRYYRNARYVICAMALGAGLWFAYDGFINWPKALEDYNRKTAAEKANGREPHSLTDINLQQRLAMGLIPLAPVLLGVFLYRSRGEYRLSGTTLHVPGHPPVPLEAIVVLDKSKWKRKGIAYVDYRQEGSDAEHRLTLDDFVYDQVPTDEIVERLDGWLNPEEPAVEETTEDHESVEPEQPSGDVESQESRSD
jgi:hypothetical protein